MYGRCETDPFDQAIDVCGSCFGEFCASCLVTTKGRRQPICKQCAIIVSGVRPGAKPLVRGSKKTADARRQALLATPAAPAPFDYYDGPREASTEAEPARAVRRSEPAALPPLGPASRPGRPGSDDPGHSRSSIDELEALSRQDRPEPADHGDRQAEARAHTRTRHRAPDPIGTVGPVPAESSMPDLSTDPFDLRPCPGSLTPVLPERGIGNLPRRRSTLADAAGDDAAGGGDTVSPGAVATEGRPTGSLPRRRSKLRPSEG